MQHINNVFYDFGTHSLFVNISPANSIMGQNTLIELSNTLSALLQGLCMNILHCILYIVMHICRNENMFLFSDLNRVVSETVLVFTIVLPSSG